MPKQTQQLSTLIKALEDIQASNIVVLDVSKQTTITDFMIICNGRSSRHVKAVAENIMPIMKASGYPVLHSSGMDSADWVLIDLGGIIVHIMQPESREFYNLEDLWQDSANENAKILP
jgi:ribosome-associated protein